MRRKIDLQYLIDQEEIRQLRHDFAWFLDTSEPDKLADLFTLDAFIEVGPWGRMDGQDAIRKGYRKLWLGAPQFNAMHSVTNGRVEIQGDEAKGSWYLLDIASGCGANENPLKLLGIYHETYRRDAEGWLMSSLTLQFLWSESTGKVTPENPLVRPRRSEEARKVTAEANARLAEEQARR